MQINVTYDASVNNAGSQFIANVQAAVQFFESEFSGPVSINIDVGFGEVDGISFTPSQAAGESRWASSVSANYATVKNILTAQGAPGAATLPSVSPLSGNLLLSPAQAKALGLVATNNNIDGFVGFSSASQKKRTWCSRYNQASSSTNCFTSRYRQRRQNIHCPQ